MTPLAHITQRLTRLIRRETAADRADWLQRSLQQAVNHHGGPARTATRSFQTAETPAYTESWSSTATDLNDDLSRQLPTLRGRSRNLARNNEWAGSYLIKLRDNVLGHQGIKLRMRAKTPSGTPDKEANQLIETWFTRWASKRGACDISGTMTFRELEALALSSLPRDGELVWRPRPTTGALLGWKLQLLPATVIDVNLNRQWGGNRVRMGIEINADGSPVAYWLKARLAGGTTTDGITSIGHHLRLPADQIQHHFIREEIDQLRGIPWLTVGARRLWLLHDFEDAAAVASSNAAKRQGFFTSADGAAPPGFADTIVSEVLAAAKAAGKVLTPDEIKALTAAAEKYNTLVPGQFDTLPHGYDFKPFDSAWPNINADGYVKQQIRGWTAARGVSYNSVGNDLESVNYSSAQVGIGQERDHFKTIQECLASWLHQPIIEALLPRIILAEPRLRMSRLADYLDGVNWQARRWTPLDPVKDATAKQINLSLKLTTRARLIAADGDDPDEVLQEAQDEEATYGPAIPRAGTPSQDNADKPSND